MSNSSRLIVIFCIWFLSLRAEAGLFRIINRDYGTAGAYQSDIDPAFNALENSVNAVLPVADNATFMKSMADTASISGAGNLANHGSAIEIFELGAHGGIAFGGSNPPTSGTFSLNNVSGVGAQAVARLGLRMDLFGSKWGFLDLTKSYLYLGYFTYRYTQDKNQFDFNAFSLYLQTRLYEPSGYLYNALRWNGLNVGTGFRYVSLKVSMPQTYSKSESVPTTIPGNPVVTAATSGTANLGAEIGIWTIPVEISTSVRLLYIFTPFVGLGTDINLGKAKSVASLNSPVTITESSNSYGTMGGTAVLDLGDESSPTSFSARSFFGVQAELGVVALTFTNTRKLSAPRDVAYNLGAKIYW